MFTACEEKVSFSSWVSVQFIELSGFLSEICTRLAFRPENLAHTGRDRQVVCVPGPTEPTGGRLWFPGRTAGHGEIACVGCTTTTTGEGHTLNTRRQGLHRTW